VSELDSVLIFYYSTAG